ncbi:hypothetical protein JX266_000063 [Neoarthrinium moseri]|nr:hypothetical protein JX266_000063 [Neoarthrinium moseri]
MNNTTAYTPLESLFLFQSLAKHGFATGAFHRISEELNQHPLIREQAAYNAARLSPELLEQLARHLLRDEQAREADAAEKAVNGAGLSPTSRKRKLPSPPLPSIKELQSHGDKLPFLVERLYARYRDDIVRQIREDEKKIDTLQRDIAELEAAEAASKAAPPPQPKLPSTNGTAAVQDGKAVKPARPNGHVSQTPIPVPTPQAQGISKPGVAIAPSPVPAPSLDRKPPQPSPSPVPSTVRPPSEIRQATPGGRPGDAARPPTGPASVLQPPQAAQAYGHPPGSVPSQGPTTDGLQRPDGLSKSQSPAPRPSPQPQQDQGSGPFKWEPPYQPHPSQTTPIPSPRHPYNTPISRPLAHPDQAAARTPQHLQAQQHHQPQPSQAHIGGQPHAIAQPNRTPTPGSTHPPHSVLVPPQNVGQFSPALPLKTPERPGPQQQQPQQHQPYRPPAVPATGPPSTAVPVPSYPNQQPQPHSGQTPVRPPVAAHNLQTPVRGSGPPPAGHRPPLAAPGQTAHHLPPVHKQAAASLPSTPVSQQLSARPQVQPKPSQAPSAGPAEQPQRPMSQASRPLVTNLPPIHPSSQPQTPSAASVSSHVIRGHGTKWTSTPTPATPRQELTGYFDAQSPAFEPLSPPIRPAQLQKTSPQQSGKKESRRNVQKIDTSSPHPPSKLSQSAQKAASRSSHLKETIEDSDGGRKIKAEEATPKPFEDAGDTTADESVQGKRTGAAAKGTKRKRHESPVNRAPPAPPTHVLWTRSFHKVSAQALEQVTSHRHANMFAHPIKARDAPGYPEIILQPQDLKRIRAAINQGQRAAQAAEKNLPDSDPNAMNVWLPISVDLIPPKGIINIAQLERELVHMFANSIMYNQDPDRGVGPSFVQSSEDDNEDAIGYEVDENGIVKETRNMFMEVEKLMSDLRSEIERNAAPPAGGPSRSMSVAAGDMSTVEDDAADEQPGDADAPSVAKRRRVRG